MCSPSAVALCLGIGALGCVLRRMFMSSVVPWWSSVPSGRITNAVTLSSSSPPDDASLHVVADQFGRPLVQGSPDPPAPALSRHRRSPARTRTLVCFAGSSRSVRSTRIQEPESPPATHSPTLDSSRRMRVSVHRTDGDVRIRQKLHVFHGSTTPTPSPWTPGVGK